jgi:hypothetical protein
MTHKELGRLVENFSSIVILALDVSRFKDILMDQKNVISLLADDIGSLNSLIFPQDVDRNLENLFPLKDAIDAFDILKGDDSVLDLSKYYDLLSEAKQMLMDGEPEVVTGGDLKRLFNHGLTLLKTGTRFHRFWEIERIILEARPGRPLTYDFKNLYTLFTNEKSIVDNFVRILKKYRFMRGENISAFYSDDYKRNPDAVFEVAMYEYAMTLVMKRYGCSVGKSGCDAVPTLNGVYMTKEHVVALVKKFRKVLIETDLIYPGREEKTAETITLLGSLFQYQSDNNKVFDVNEGTEFAISLFTSIDVADDIYKDFKALNTQEKCEMDSFGRVAPDCFKQKFFESVCFNYPDQFPKLFASLGATVYEIDASKPNTKKLVCKIPENAPNLAYLDRATLAARTCHIYPDDKKEIFYSKGDMMSIFLAMMHIETTIIRWDTRNYNNVMDPAEVMDAYDIYSPALDGFLEEMPGVVKKLKKQIYQYMIKYEQIPNEKDFGSIWKFVKFLVSFNKGATANRKTIASILVTIGEQGATSLFDCNLLHDPENMPEDYDSNRDSAPVSVTEARPLVLTRDDATLAREIEGQSDSWIKFFLNLNWPGIFRF